MKKILTLAIALVMVFAIAAPAFASGWDIEIEEVELKDLTLQIQALDTEKSANTTWNGGSGYAILESTYPVIAGTEVHAVVTVTVPASANLSSTMKYYISNGQTLVWIDTTNLKDVKIKQVFSTDGKSYFSSTLTAADPQRIQLSSNDINTDGTTITFEITANAESSNADAKIVAKLGVYNEWKDGSFYFEKNGEGYTVSHTTDSFTVTSTTGAAVTFPTDDSDYGEIDTTKFIVVDGIDCGKANIVKQVNNILAFEGVNSSTVYTSGTIYNDLKASMDEIFGVLGFDYEGAKYMQEDHFTKFFGTIMEGTDSLTYPTGYVAELVTDDPSVNPPQTGDNASVVGFVMIAIALVAAAAVTVKKVRA